MQHLKVSNVEFKCTSVGENGPLLMLLHGYGGGPLEYHHLIPHLSSNFRLLIPNLSPLFSSQKPLSFSKQVELLSGLTNALNPSGETFVLVGSSYGGTLSFGLRAHFQSLVLGHVLVNPMPLDPLGSLKSGQLKVLFGLNMVPGALPLFLKTKMGRELLVELASHFGFGERGHRELGGMSDRKLNLISKAVQRFAWIAQSEDWTFWQKQLMDHVIPTLIMSGAKDTLFSERDFRSYQMLVPMSEHRSIEEGDHLMIRTRPEILAPILIEYVNQIEGLTIEPRLAKNNLSKSA